MTINNAVNVFLFDDYAPLIYPNNSEHGFFFLLRTRHHICLYMLQNRDQMHNATESAEISLHLSTIVKALSRNDIVKDQVLNKR
jgi:hypothetical protein